MPGTSSLYAAIDLGSNSFHMLVVREVAGSIQTLTRVKRKVRLAAGLGADNALSADAMERGWQCLRLFAERLQDIPPSQIRVVATATMLGIPVPAFASSLSYYDGLRAERLPAALTQGQRDFFGAHTYERIDKPGKFHTLWSGDRSEIEA